MLLALPSHVSLREFEYRTLQVMPSCDDFLLRCWWQGKLQDCSALFEVRKSNEGFCCTFNAIKLSESIDLWGLTTLHLCRVIDDLPCYKLFLSSVVKDILAKHNLHDLGTDRLPGSLMEFMPENMNHHEASEEVEPWTKNGTEAVLVGENGYFCFNRLCCQFRKFPSQRNRKRVAAKLCWDPIGRDRVDPRGRNGTRCSAGARIKDKTPQLGKLPARIDHLSGLEAR